MTENYIETCYHKGKDEFYRWHNSSATKTPIIKLSVQEKVIQSPINVPFF